MKTCPRCALISPPSAERCDCGYRFADETPAKLEAEFAAALKRARRGVIQGFFAIGIGLVVSIGSFVLAKPGGYFLVATGAIVGGLTLVGRSWGARLRLSAAKKETSKTQMNELD